MLRLGIIAVLLLQAVTPAPATGAVTLLQQAQAAEQANTLQASLTLYQQVLQTEPANQQAQDGDARVSEKLALAARGSGDTDGALRLLLNAGKVSPGNRRLLYDTGVLEDSMGLYWDADAAVERLRALPGGDPPAVLYLAARIKLDLGQLSAAAALMRDYLKTHPEDASAHYGLGRMLQLQEHFAEAKAQFEQSLQLAPRQTESQFQLGEIALAQNQYQQAIEDYAQTLQGNPNHAGALAGTGIAWFHLQDYSKAEAALRQAIAKDPQYQTAHYYLGLTLARLGRKAEAQQQLAQAAAMAQAQAETAAQRLHLHPGSASPAQSTAQQASKP